MIGGVANVIGLDVASKFGSLLIEEKRIVVHPEKNIPKCDTPLRIASQPMGAYHIILNYPVTANADRDIGGNCMGMCSCCPRSCPQLPRISRNLLGRLWTKKKAVTLSIAGIAGLLGTSVDVELVEVAGVEPASEGA
jgi:hypothetical protein